MELWVFVAIAAAFVQNLRFMLQKVLSSGRLTTAGATFSRFVYSAPLVWGLLWLYAPTTGQKLPELSVGFWGFVLFGGLSQVLATLCVVALFRQRNFAVGTTLMKTETLLSVLVGFVFLGDVISPGAFVAILLGVVAVMLLAQTPASTGPLMRRIWTRATGLGLGAGLLFSFSAVFYRGATLELASGDTFLRAALTLAWVTTTQALGMALWMRWREVGQITKVLRAWKTAGLVGVTSMIGSLCWFAAFALQNAAYVKAVGQVEMMFSVLTATLVFRESVTRREILGIVVLAVATVALILLK